MVRATSVGHSCVEHPHLCTLIPKISPWWSIQGGAFRFMDGSKTVCNIKVWTCVLITCWTTSKCVECVLIQLQGQLDVLWTCSSCRPDTGHDRHWPRSHDKCFPLSLWSFKVSDLGAMTSAFPLAYGFSKYGWEWPLWHEPQRLIPTLTFLSGS